jgi:hypothetical protein
MVNTMQKVLNPLLNPWMMFLLRSPFHRRVSDKVLLLTVTGRKRGRAITFPVQYLQDGHSVQVISQQVGKVWWKHLVGGANVALRLRGQARGLRRRQHRCGAGGCGAGAGRALADGGTTRRLFARRRAGRD